MNSYLTMDEIRIEGLEVFAHHGVFPEETQEGQTFVINACLYTDTRKAGDTDDLSLSTDYGAVCLFMHRWMQENTYKLLESVAEKLARAVLLYFPLVRSIDLEIRKPHAPIPLELGCVSVKVNRGWRKAYLAIGSNLGEKEKYLQDAVEALRGREKIHVLKISSYITTKPYGGVEQDDFLNGAIEVETLCTPEELLDVLHEIENEAGRVRTVHWGPRTLDLDILFYEDLVCDTDRLTIPHRDLQNRDFVLLPMKEIAPHFRHPVFEKTISRLWEEYQSMKNDL